MSYEYDEEYYYSFRKIILWFMNILYDMKSTGIDNIPVDSNYILVGNHLNILDAALIANFVDCNLRFMVDNKLYRYKLWESFFKRLGTFGINPEKLDLKAVKTALELSKNYNLVIFPEGKTHKLEENVAFKPGIARLSSLSNSIVVPFGINGTYKPFTNLQINFGEPIDFKKIDIRRNEMDSYIEENVRKLQR